MVTQMVLKHKVIKLNYIFFLQLNYSVTAFYFIYVKFSKTNDLKCFILVLFIHYYSINSYFE